MAKEMADLRAKNPLTKLNRNEISPEQILEIDRVSWSKGHRRVVSKIWVKKRGRQSQDMMYIDVDDLKAYPSALVIEFMKGLIHVRIDAAGGAREETERRVQEHMK